MAIWSILAAPLLISADLRTMRPEMKMILLNRQVIAVNQDPLGIQGRRVYKVCYFNQFYRLAIDKLSRSRSQALKSG